MLDSPLSGPVVERFTSGDSSFFLRQLLPEDMDPYLRFFNGLDPETIRCRFGHLVSPLNRDTAQSMVCRDPQWEPALAIFEEMERQIVAIGRFSTDFSRKSAEIAMVVASEWRRRGLAKWLLQSLIDLAASKQLSFLHAYVSTKNAPVQVLLRDYGFRFEGIDDGESTFTLSLNTG